MTSVLTLHINLLKNLSWEDFCEQVKIVLRDEMDKDSDFGKCFEHYDNENQLDEFFFTFARKLNTTRDDLQHCLNTFVEVVLENLKVGSGLMYIMCDIIDVILEMDNRRLPEVYRVRFPTKRLIEKKCSGEVTLGEEIREYWARGVLLDEFEPKDVYRLEIMDNWKDIVAEKPYDLEIPCTESKRLSVLKYYSEYLQGTRWTPFKNN
jgi:hypothetical protein